jgi:hypothetical protein
VKLRRGRQILWARVIKGEFFLLAGKLYDPMDENIDEYEEENESEYLEESMLE